LAFGGATGTSRVRRVAFERALLLIREVAVKMMAGGERQMLVEVQLFLASSVGICRQ
jgi:hypothetical protein